MTEISFCDVIVLQKQNRMSFVKCILVFLAGFILGAQIICPKWVYHRQNQPKTPPNLSLPLWFPRKRLVSPSYLILRKFYPPPPQKMTSPCLVDDDDDDDDDAAEDEVFLCYG